MDATSEACPSRRAGIRSTTLSLGTGALPGLRPSMIALSMRLAIRPGQTTLTRPLGALQCGALGDPDHRMLAGAVNRDVGRADQAGNRGGVDDAALVLFEHCRH